MKFQFWMKFIAAGALVLAIGLFVVAGVVGCAYLMITGGMQP